MVEKLKKRFPGDTSNYGLFAKTKSSSKNTLVKLEESRLVLSYRQIHDPKVKLIFGDTNDPDGRVRYSLLFLNFN